MRDWVDRVHQGNALDLLREMPENYVDMAMCSPPYWGLRSYGKDTEVDWGGDPGCKHYWGSEISGSHSNVPQTKNPEVHQPRGDPRGNICQQCGAWHGQLGLEPTIAMYVDHLLIVLHEVKRVLKKTGSFWLNIGDTYSASLGPHQDKTAGIRTETMVGDDKRPPVPYEVPRKSLCGIPWRVLLGLINDGWACRNVVVWQKPNHMPSSVKDRLSASWEPIFHFTKSPRYYYDLDAIRVKPLTFEGRPGGAVRTRELGYNSKFNIRVRDAQEGRLESKWGGLYAATDEEVENYDEKAYSGKFTKMDPAQAELFNSPRARNLRQPKTGAARTEHQRQIAEDNGFPSEATGRASDRGLATAGLYDPERTSFQHPLGKNPNDFWSFNASEADLIWLAAIVDAEGAIYMTRRDRKGEDIGWKNAEFTSYIEIVNTDIALMRNVKRIVDGILGKQHSLIVRPLSDQGYKDIHRLALSGNEAQLICLAIGPHLIAKRQRAELVVQLQEEKTAQNVPFKEMSPETINARQFLFAKMKRYNTLGENVDPGVPDIWNITTRAFREAHFATFPEALCIRPILASCPVGGVVLDTFAGAGTVGLVAKRLHRHYVLLEVKKAYCEMARKRLATHPPPLDQWLQADTTPVPVEY